MIAKYRSVAAGLMVALALAGGARGATPQPAANQANMLYYQFNTGPDGGPVAMALDSGPNHQNGVVTGSLTYSANVAPTGGKFSLNATGDVDYVTVAQTADNMALLNPAHGLTLSALADPTGGTTLDAVGDLIAGKLADYVSGPCDTSYGIWWVSTTRHFIAGVCDANRDFLGITSADSFATNTWHTVVLKIALSSRGKATATLTVDGTLEGSMSLANFPGMLEGSGSFQIGASNIVCDTCEFRRNFVGYIDQVKIVGVP